MLEKSAKERQEGGDHYKKLGQYQPWQVLQAWLTPEEYRGYLKGTMIAYLAREREKGGDLDIRKAVHTGEWMLEVSKLTPSGNMAQVCNHCSTQTACIHSGRCAKSQA